MAPQIKKIALAAIPFVVLVLVWQVLHVTNAVPKWLIPTPFETAKTFWQLTVDGTLLRLVAISAANAVPAFLLALVFATIFGTLIGLHPTARQIFFPFLSALYPIPSLAWLPLIILFLGFTRETIWAVVFISSFMRMIYNVIGGVRGVNINWILAAKNLGLGKMQIIYKVILPGALPQIMTGMRMGFGSSWRSLIGAEMLVVSLGGLGKFIWMAQWFFDFDKVFAGIVVIAIIGVGIERLVFRRLERATLLRWGLIREDGGRAI